VRVGQILLEEGRRVKLAAVARSLDVDIRTLRNWKQQAREAKPKRKLGRPASSLSVRQAALWCVGRELRKQGYPGWRAVAFALKGRVPTRLVQSYVSQFKQKRKERKARRLAKNRIRVEVLARDVIWGQDGTHVGRCNAHAVESQVIRDRGSGSFVGVGTGRMADHQTVIELLKKSALARGGLPWVLARDNGSMYAHEAVSRYLEEQKVIVLRSLPRTPQHNGATERAIRELKEAAELGKGVRIHDPREVALSVERMALRLNANRIRPSKGFKTADELDDTLPAGTICDRDLFYQQCRKTMERAVQGAHTQREARMAEREAVWLTLEKFGMIKRRRGGNCRVQN
jgi:transposase InsO family protein